MTVVKLRPYQIEAIEAAQKFWAENPTGNPGISLPTGAGKTVVMSELARQSVAAGKRVAIIVHRHELVEQTLAKLRAADPMMFIGTVKASKNEAAAEVVVCSLQTLARPGRVEKILPRDVVIYDEAHGSASDSAIDVMTRLNALPGDPVQAVGFSATFFRNDRRPLDVIWDEIVYHKDILWAVQQGFLSDARGLTIPIPALDLTKVKVSGGDYTDRDLGQQMLDSHAAEYVAKAFVKHAPERKAISFAPTVAAAQEIAKQLNAVGIAAETVTGATKAGDRAEMYRRLREGETRVLSSVAVLTEGFDDPSVDCVIMARPTKARGLYIQCVGRGLRLNPGKKDCLILDVAGIADEQSLMSMTQLAGKMPKKKGEEEDDSLLELARDIEPAERAVLGLKPNLKPEERPFDPFARSRKMWLTTHGGKRFLATERGTWIFLREVEEDGYSVGIAERRSSTGGRKGRWLEPGPIPLNMAMDLAETYLDEIGAPAKKGASWLYEPATVSQIGFAERLGIAAPEGIKRGELSKAIDRELASRAID